MKAEDNNFEGSREEISVSNSCYPPGVAENHIMIHSGGKSAGVSVPSLPAGSSLTLNYTVDNRVYNDNSVHRSTNVNLAGGDTALGLIGSALSKLFG